MSDLGTDFSGVTDLDAQLTQVSGRRCLAQALLRRWITLPGTLFYNRNYGAGLLAWLNGSTPTAAEVAFRLEREALKDERVEAVAVSAIFTPPGERLEVAARVTDALGPFDFMVRVHDLRSTGEGRSPAIELFMGQA